MEGKAGIFICQSSPDLQAAYQYFLIHAWAFGKSVAIGMDRAQGFTREVGSASDLRSEFTK